MKARFTKEQEVLGLLVEECAEIIQQVSKVNRFGPLTEHDGVTHKAALQQEIGDVVALVYIITRKLPHVLNEEDLEKAIQIKMERLKKYLPEMVENIEKE